MDNSIVRFPIKTWRRIRNRRGKRSVSCHVTDRWLTFDETAKKNDLGNGEVGTVFFVHVMTDASGDSSRKICELCITLEDLQKAVGNIRIEHAKL
jgi:hypothetical protein